MQGRRKIYKLLITVGAHNPFYLLSACLILYGLYVSLGSTSAGQQQSPLPLVIALCAYMAIMAVTAWLIVQLTKAWDDARSVLLLLLLLLVPLSVSFDAVCNSWGQAAIAVVACGFGFSILVSEFVLRGLQIKFPPLLRAPLYLILGLFFLYPLLLSTEIAGGTKLAVSWKILLFPSIAGVAFLSLIPALRKRSGYIAKSGTPWKWPWFPWTVFGVLAVGICVRSYTLAVTFQPYPAFSHAFGSYFLTPFLFAMVLLLLEFAVVERRSTLQRVLLSAAPLLLITAAAKWHIGSEYVFNAFHGLFVQQVGSPIWITAWGLVLLYGYALGRGLHFAEIGLVGGLLLTCFVGRQTVSQETIAIGPWSPLMAIGLFQLLQSIHWRSSWRCVFAAACLVTSSSLHFRDSAYLSFHGFIPINAAIASIVIISCAFRDRLSDLLKPIGAAFLFTAGLAAMFFGHHIGLPVSARVAYCACVILAAFSGWFWANHRALWFAGLGSAAAGVGVLVTLGSVVLCDTMGGARFASFALGLVSFSTAAALTLLKTNWGRAILAHILSRLFSRRAFIWLIRLPRAIQQLLLAMLPSTQRRQHRRLARHALARSHVIQMFEILSGESNPPDQHQAAPDFDQAARHWCEAVHLVGHDAARGLANQSEDLTTIRLHRGGAEAKAIYQWLFNNIGESDQYAVAIADITLAEAVDLLRQRRYIDFFEKIEEAQCWDPDLQIPVADLIALGDDILTRIMTKIQRTPAAWLPSAASPRVILRALSSFAALRKQIPGPLRISHVDLFMQTVTQSAAEAPREVAFLEPVIA